MRTRVKVFAGIRKSLRQIPVLVACLRLLALAVLLCLTLFPGALQARGIQSEWDGIQRVIAIGDIHGDYQRFTQLLKEAGLINSRLGWSGGDTHLVQLGDLVDRMPDSRKVIDLLRDLEKQAPRKGGYVHVLIGNHEAMRMQGDMRYTVSGEYSAFVDRNSTRRRERYYQTTLDYLKKTLPEESLPLFDDAYRAKWEQQFPLGYVEMRIAWSPAGEYGRWVLGHNAIIRIDDTLFVHGGLNPEYGKLPLDQINDRVREELASEAPVGADALINAESGPLWYRGLARNEETCDNLRDVEGVLAAHGVRHIVVGHTPLAGAILPRFGGAVVLADAGLSAHYEGARAALIIDRGSLYALHEGVRIPLAGSRQNYLTALSRVTPVPPLLAQYLAQPDHLAAVDLSCPTPPLATDDSAPGSASSETSPD